MRDSMHMQQRESTLDHHKEEHIILMDLHSKKEECSIGLEFDRGVMAENDGSVGPRTYFLLSLPNGAYPDFNFREDMQDSEDFLRHWAMTYGLSSEGNVPALALHLAPNLALSTSGFQLFLKCVAWYESLKGFLEGAPKRIGRGFLKDLTRVSRNILTHQYRSTGGIPGFAMSPLDRAFRALFDISEDFRARDPKGQLQTESLVQVTENWVNSTAHVGQGWRSEFWSLSALSEGGGRVLFEMLQLINGVQIPEAVQRSFLYRTFLGTGATIMELVRRVLLDSSGSDAVTHQTRLINGIMRDFSQGGNDVIKEFSDISEITTFVNDYKCFVDGLIYFSAHNRLGCNCTLRKVVFQ